MRTSLPNNVYNVIPTWLQDKYDKSEGRDRILIVHDILTEEQDGRDEYGCGEGRCGICSGR